MNALARIANIIFDHTGVAPQVITPGTRLGDVSTEAEEWFGILAEIEIELRIEIDELEFEGLGTIGELLDLVNAKSRRAA